MFLRIWRSLKLTNVLLLLLISFFLIGAFKMVSDPATSGLSTEPLFAWLRKHPLSTTWWLWGATISAALLGLNTLVCTLETLLFRWRALKGRSDFLVRVAAQIAHLGFGLLLIAHLLSAVGHFRGQVLLARGMSFELPDGKARVELSDLSYQVKQGYLTGLSARLRVTYPEGTERDFLVAPNRPALVEGYGIYLKRLFGGHAVVLEVTRDAGTYWALAGGLLFLTGSLLLVLLRFRGN